MRWFTAGFFILIFILAAGLLSGGCGAYVYETIIYGFAVMALLGVVCAMPCMGLWRWLTDGAARWFCGVLHVVFFTVFLSGLLIGLNFMLTDFSSLPEVKAEVVDKYSETHYRSRRVGRNRYTRGEPYKVYKVQFRLDNGSLRTFQLPLSRYNKLRIGSAATLHQGPGALGVPVIAY